MMSRLLFIVFITQISSLSASAQTTPRQLAEQFFVEYAKDPANAVGFIFRENKWVAKNEESITNVKNKLKNTIELMGEYHGYEALTEATAGSRITQLSYLVFYDRQPMRFTFVFYKPKDTWRLNNFSYEESISEELDEAMKIYRLPENQK